jgi:hypothetical protein
MKDSDIRGLVLQAFYDHRNEPHPFQPEVQHFGGRLTDLEIFRGCEQLAQNGLIEGTIRRLSYGAGGGFAFARITADGADVIEGSSTPPVAVTIMGPSYSISHSTNVAIGDGNQQKHQSLNDCVAELARIIEAAKATPSAKEEAKSLLRRFLEHPLLAAVAGGALALLG